jgi:hypothetical protein
MLEEIEKRTNVEITSNLTDIKVILQEIVSALNKGPKSRERSLVITKLEEAEMWAIRGQSRE